MTQTPEIDHRTAKRIRVEIMNAGTNIAHYNILRPLAKGGMGEVHLADDWTRNRAYVH